MIALLKIFTARVEIHGYWTCVQNSTHSYHFPFHFRRSGQILHILRLQLTYEHRVLREEVVGFIFTPCFRPLMSHIFIDHEIQWARSLSS